MVALRLCGAVAVGIAERIEARVDQRPRERSAGCIVSRISACALVIFAVKIGIRIIRLLVIFINRQYTFDAVVILPSDICRRFKGGIAVYISYFVVMLSACGVILTARQLIPSIAVF